MAPIDLRSDTVTRPTAAMREAMFNVEVGDDVYGEDPTVNALQARVAADLGFESALFLPSGTQSNLCALLAHCERGDEYIVGMEAHTYKYEGGGAAVLGSIQPQPIPQTPQGMLPLNAVEAAIKPVDPHFARTRLLCLENTWMGQALPLVGRTPEREAIYDFTFPYMTLFGAIVVRNDTSGIAGLDDLRGRSVAVMKGDNAEEFLRREDRGIDIRTTPGSSLATTTTSARTSPSSPRCIRCAPTSAG